MKRRALVTGGSSGIGLAIAKALAAAGHDVTIAARDRAKLEASGLRFVEMDVTDEASVAAAVRQAGAIDIFIANAGAAETATAVKTPRALWDRMLALNLTSVYLCAREAIPPMIERGWGRFVVVASTASLHGSPYASAYVAAKHGALGFVRSLALELARTGVTANALCPGYTRTPMLERAIDIVTAKTGRARDAVTDGYGDRNPGGRLVEPEEVALAALALCAESSTINGEAIVLDGSAP